MGCHCLFRQLAIWHLLKCVKKTDFILSVLTKQQQQQKRKQKFGEMDIFTTMIMVVAQTNQNAYIKCVQFLLYQLYLNKAKTSFAHGRDLTNPKL